MLDKKVSDYAADDIVKSPRDGKVRLRRYLGSRRGNRLICSVCFEHGNVRLVPATSAPGRRPGSSVFRSVKLGLCSQHRAQQERADRAK